MPSSRKCARTTLQLFYHFAGYFRLSLSSRHFCLFLLNFRDSVCVCFRFACPNQRANTHGIYSYLKKAERPSVLFLSIQCDNNAIVKTLAGSFCSCCCCCYYFCCVFDAFYILFVILFSFVFFNCLKNIL